MVTAGAVHQGGDRGLVAASDDQVAFPVTDADAGADDRWPVVDQLGGRDEPAASLVGAPTSFAHRPAGPQLLGECAAQAAFPAVVDGLVDRLVADVPAWPVRERSAQVVGDLLGAPLQLETSRCVVAPAWTSTGSTESPRRPALVAARRFPLATGSRSCGRSRRPGTPPPSPRPRGSAPSTVSRSPAVVSGHASPSARPLLPGECCDKYSNPREHPGSKFPKR